jgi:hypothetical protein
MSDRVREGNWQYATWEGARRQALESTLAATPAQRLAWLEEMLEIACRAGALDPGPADGSRRRS